MNVLGIHAYIHDSGACLISGGEFRAISEERLDRVKHSAAFPERSVRYLMDASGVGNINEIDLVVYDMFERQGEETLRGIRALGYSGRVESIRHHDAHAASAYFASPFDDSAVLVVDGAGSNGEEYPPGAPWHYLQEHFGWMQEVQSFYRGAGASLSLVRRTFATPEHSLGVGFLYGAACEYLGFDKLDGGKLMGLAAYGKSLARFKYPFEDMGGDLLIPFKRERLLEGGIGELRRIFGGVPPRAPGEKIPQSHKDVARFVQDSTEAAMLLLARNLKNITGSKNICLAGGVALNGAANYLISENAGFEGVFIQPAANDYGIPFGCALYGLHVIRGRKKRIRMKDAFLGREYSEAEVRAEIKRNSGGLKAIETSAAHEAAARAIAEGKIVGLFDGACEYGPRALGARAILADPRNPEIKDILNARVKFREAFRPYAPAVLEEYAAEYFDTEKPSPYMLMIVKARPGKAKEIPGVLHVDGTARLQTIGKKTAPALRSIISAFHGITGIPMLLNTSMNVSGEPIAETPGDAVRCLLDTGMDMLLIGNMLLEKRK